MSELLINIDPTIYTKFVTMENVKYVIYAELLKALHGLLKESLLFQKKLFKGLKDIGFKLNTYEPYIANIILYEKQHTIVWHVDDVNSSHVDPKFNDKFIQ